MQPPASVYCRPSESFEHEWNDQLGRGDRADARDVPLAATGFAEGGPEHEIRRRVVRPQPLQDCYSKDKDSVRPSLSLITQRV